MQEHHSYEGACETLSVVRRSEHRHAGVVAVNLSIKLARLIGRLNSPPCNQRRSLTPQPAWNSKRRNQCGQSQVLNILTATAIESHAHPIRR